MTWWPSSDWQSPLFQNPSLNQIVERQLARSTGQQEHQDRSPEQVFGPCLWINERLDHRDHPEQRQRGNARRQANDQENRERQLVEGGEAGRPHRIQQWHLILILEQLDRELPRIDLE